MGSSKRANRGKKARIAAKPRRAPRHGDERLKRLLELSSDWYWEQDERHRFTQIVGGALGKSGFDAKDYLGKTRWDGGGEPVGDGGSWDQHKATLKARRPFTDFVFKRSDSNGELRYISSSGQPVLDDQGRFTGYRGIAKDVTRRVRAELRHTIEHGATRILAQSVHIADAAPRILRLICETLGWAGGARWELDAQSNTTRRAETWGVPESRVDEFFEATQLHLPANSGGLVRQTRASGEPVWIRDVSREPTFLRAPHALKAGLHSAFAFPIGVGPQMMGIMEFFSREIHQPDIDLLNAARNVGAQIGQFMRSKQAEDALRENEARFRKLTELSSDWYWEQDAGLRFIRLEGRHVTGDNSAFANELGKTREALGVEVEGGWEAHRALVEARQPFRDVVMWRVSADGRRHYMSISGEPMVDGEGRFVGYRGVGKNITERRHDEQLMALEHTVNRCLTEANDVPAALKAVIRALCESQNWQCGRYFRLDQDAGLLRYEDSWTVPGANLDEFIARSREVTYAPGQGLAGRVWQSGKPLWVDDVSKDPRMTPHGIAAASGLRGTFLFPVTAEGQTVGVFTFISREVREPDERMQQAVRVIGSQIGQFVQRKRSEQTALRFARMFAALSATNDAILHAQTPQELYQQMCDAAVHGGRFSNTSVFLVEAGNARVKAVAGAGRVPQDLSASYISIDETIPEGRGLVGIAFRTRKPCVSNDFLNDERTRPWHEIGRKAGCRAAGALPLVQGGRSVGAVLIHYDELNAFDDEIVKLLERMAENVSFALDNFERAAERVRAQARIEYLATHDGLTDLPNRTMFSQVLNLAISSARRYNRHFAVLFVDLDRFKIINDTLGHEAGDRLLQEMSRRLKEHLRASDVVARLGGDEFVVLVQEVNEPEQVAIVARKLLSTIIKPVMVLEQECRVTASIGISIYPTDAQDEQGLMKNADVAMYLAKEEGKNNFQFYSKDIKTQSLERLTLETSLRQALERGEFFLHYQAKLDLTSGTITGVETLVRWQHPDRGMVSPLQFIPLAEETGLIVPIGKWVLQTACAQNVAWQRAGLPPVCMAVNLSPRQFNDENLLSDIASVLRETGMAPQLLELEITESMVMGNIDRAAKQLTAIKQMGVRLAIDDFGTGYSSLAQIKRFPIDTIKVDRSFIREVPRDSEDMAITKAIIAMGKSLSLTVVAEGVETGEQQAFLRENACDEMQGFYFSKPVAPEQFAELLRTHVAAPAPQK